MWWWHLPDKSPAEETDTGCRVPTTIFRKWFSRSSWSIRGISKKNKKYLIVQEIVISCDTTIWIKNSSLPCCWHVNHVIYVKIGIISDYWDYAVLFQKIIERVKLVCVCECVQCKLWEKHLTSQSCKKTHFSQHECSVLWCGHFWQTVRLRRASFILSLCDLCWYIVGTKCNCNFW